MKKLILGVVTMVSFLSLFNIVGALELDKVTAGQGAVQIAVWGVVFILGCIIKR